MPNHDVACGLCRRYNVDQVPLGFLSQSNICLAPKGEKRVWVAGTKGADEKRMATLQICVNMVNPVNGRHKQIKQTVTFRGTGLRITAAERAAWDQRVIVRFQPSAWYDQVMCNEWVAEDFAPQVDPTTSKGLYCDNLDGQTTTMFESALYKVNTDVHLLPTGESHHQQYVVAAFVVIRLLYIYIPMKSLDVSIVVIEDLILWISRGRVTCYAFAG